MQRLCPRCHYAVTVEDGTLCYCSHCGAPQVRLSEELQGQIATQRDELAEREAAAANAAPTGPVAPGEIDWRGAIQCAALAGAISFLLTLLSEPVPVLVLLSLFWAIGAPIVTLGIYVNRFRRTRIAPGFAARLGLLTGMAVLVGSSIVNVAAMLIQRYALHHGGEFDALFNDRVRALQDALTQQSGAAAAPVVGLLNVPEFRAGMLLGGFAIFAAGYLLFSAAGGAFAGLLRGRRSSAA